MCSEFVPDLIGPCRATCHEVKENCGPLLTKFVKGWPPALDCEQFPVANVPGSLCMDSVGRSEDQTVRKRPTTTTTTMIPAKVKPPKGRSGPVERPRQDFSKPEQPSKTLPSHTNGQPPVVSPPSRGLPPSTSKANSGSRRVRPISGRVHKHFCLEKFHPDAYVFINSSGVCAPVCGARDAFAEEDKFLITVWMGAWAGLCFMSTVLAMVTFLLDTTRVRFPERPVIFVSLSYCLHSLGYLIRLVAGKESISCDSSKPWSLLIQGDLENTNCTLVFLLLYFFGLAGATWWAVLCFSWMLSTAAGFSPERIASLASFFHVVSWGVPAVLSIAVVVLRDVSGDELTGLCFVGGSTTSTTADNLVGFVIVPLVIILVAGALCLAISRIKLVCGQRNRCGTHPASSSATSSLTKVPVDGIGGRASPSSISQHPSPTSSRTFAFAVLFAIPLACVIACYLYEHANRLSWYNRTRSTTEHSGAETSWQGVDATAEAVRPSVAVFMLKIFAWLSLGVLCCLSLLSDKSALIVWRNKLTAAGRRKTERFKGLPSQRHYMPVNTAGGIANVVPPRVFSSVGLIDSGARSDRPAYCGVTVPQGCDV